VVVLMTKQARHRSARLAAGLTLLAATLLAARPAIASAQTVGQLVRSDDLTTLRSIGVPGAWTRTRGSGVTVAVLDTGVDTSAPDLAGSVTVGPDYTAGANPPGYQPPYLHGTYICSIIAGHGSGPGQAEGMLGVAPLAHILSVRVILDDSEPGFAVYNENAAYDDAIANGIDYAVGHGASVINMSLGGPDATRSLREAVANAIARGVVVVAAAGNDGTAGGGFTSYSYPASFTGVISVAAVGQARQRASFSDRNSSVVVSAPGVGVDGAGPGGQYLTGDGTSPASAFVAGVAALLRSAYPRLTPVQVMQAIVTTTTRPAGGYSTGVGFGEVNAAAALTAAGQLAQPVAGAGEQPPAARFVRGRIGPIVVVPRDIAQIAAPAAVAFAALIGFLAATVALFAGARRRRRPLVADDLQIRGPDDDTA
jgi:type VII secretion-associated serine protease mycosin